jgi:hypothetical protein
MSKVIALSDELYDRLHAQAGAQSLSVEVYLERLQNEAERANEVSGPPSRLRTAGHLA